MQRVRPPDPPFPGNEEGEKRWELSRLGGGGGRCVEGRCLWLVLLTVPALENVWSFSPDCVPDTVLGLSRHSSPPL